jgi:processive 1,2-diacylglycerol beta-glucosyltransferase
MAARAIRESLDHRAAPNVVMDILDFSSDLFKWSYSDVYAFVSEHSHLACRLMYDLTDKNREESVALRLFEKITIENVKKFMRYISENEPGVCICTHYFPLNVLSRMKEEGMYRGDLHTVITDFGLRRMWVKDNVDRYFISGDRVHRGLLAMGVPGEKISVTGIPVSRKFASLGTTRRDFTKKRLSVLFVASSIPSILALDILAALSDTGHPMDVSVVTGRNRDLFADLQNVIVGRRLSLNILGFVDNLEELMARASFMITKPGGLTVSEALCAGAPMILVNPIPKQETKNSAYLQEKGAGLAASSAAEVGEVVRRLFADRKLLGEMEKAAFSIAYPKAADDVADEVLRSGNRQGTSARAREEGSIL